MSTSTKPNVRVLYILLAVSTSLMAAAWLNRDERMPTGVTDPMAEDILSRASSACLVEITSLEEFDERPSDGDHWLKASYRVIRSSGDVPGFLHLVIDPAGMTAPGYNFKPPVELNHNSLSIGERHWIVFGSEGDGSRFPYGITGWWPHDADDLPAVVIAAVEQDRFKWRPVYDQAAKLTHEWLHDTNANTMTVRVRDRDRTLWAHTLHARPDPNHQALYVWHHPSSYEMAWPTDGESKGLQVKLIQQLPTDNEFQVPAGMYRVDYVFNLRTGRKLATWVAANQTAWNLHAFRQYDEESGKLLIASDMTSLSTGGLKVGADSDDWLRKVERQFDADSGKLMSSQTFRHGTIKTPDGVHLENGWIPVDD